MTYDISKARNRRSARAWRSGETHECAVEGCGEVINRELLMCFRHWFQVPRSMRDAVWQTWKVFLRGGSREAYEAARAAAIRSVEGKP